MQDRNFYSLHLFLDRIFLAYFPHIYFHLYSIVLYDYLVLL